MNLDPKTNIAGAAVITLAGAEYFVPALSLRQARIVVPGLLKLLPRLNAIQSAIGENVLGAALLEGDDIELMIDIVHAGLTRAYPDATRDELLDFETGFPELAVALGVIAKQTGLFSPASAPAGETRGEATPPTSTASSPAIANTAESLGQTPLNPN